MTAAVEFQSVSRYFGSTRAVDGVDLTIAEGAFFAMLGPSGSGKTTVLRMLMTLESINGGVIYIDGKPLTHMERNGVLVPADEAHLRRMRASIGMCFQHFNLFPHLTVLENLTLGPIWVLKTPRAEAEALREALTAHNLRAANGDEITVADELEQAASTLEAFVVADKEHPLLDCADDDGVEYQSEYMASLMDHATINARTLRKWAHSLRAALSKGPTQ